MINPRIGDPDYVPLLDVAMNAAVYRHFMSRIGEMVIARQIYKRFQSEAVPQLSAVTDIDTLPYGIKEVEVVFMPNGRIEMEWAEHKDLRSRLLIAAGVLLNNPTLRHRGMFERPAPVTKRVLIVNHWGCYYDAVGGTQRDVSISYAYDGMRDKFWIVQPKPKGY